MKFKKTPHSIEDFKADKRFNLLIPVLAIHDEVDFLIDSNLLHPIINRLDHIAKVRHIFDKVGFKYIPFQFDYEFDLTNRTFLPLDSYSPFKAYIEYLQNKVIESPTIKKEASGLSTPKEGVDRLTVAQQWLLLEDDPEKIQAILDTLPTGGNTMVILSIKVGADTFTREITTNPRKLREHLSKIAKEITDDG